MAENAEQVTSFVLNHMKASDMRPKEDFRIGDQVQVIDRGITGKIMKFDPDHRMAWLGNGWWYLKDLKKQSLAKPQGTQREFFRIEGFGALPSDYLLEGARNYLFEGVDFSLAFGVPPSVIEINNEMEICKSGFAKVSKVLVDDCKDIPEDVIENVRHGLADLFTVNAPLISDLYSVSEVVKSQPNKQSGKAYGLIGDCNV